MSRKYSQLFVHKAGSIMMVRLEDWGHTASLPEMCKTMSDMAYGHPGKLTMNAIFPKGSGRGGGGWCGFAHINVGKAKANPL